MSEFWNLTATIEGWFSFEEASQYHAILSNLPDNASVVEVGIYHGRSTSVPGQLMKTKFFHLACVDIFGPDFDGTPYLDKFQANMKRIGVEDYLTIVGDSNVAKAYFPLESIDLVFIDANHERPWIELDCAVWLPRLKSGGWAVFHDYEPHNFPDVFDTVKRVCAGWDGGHVQTLAYRRKP
jgi:predicted O-methyltransferase YrrM